MVKYSVWISVSMALTIGLTLATTYFLTQYGENSDGKCQMKSMQELTCMLCVHTTNSAHHLSKMAVNQDQLIKDIDNIFKDIIGIICGAANWMTARVCRSYVQSKVVELVYIFNTTRVTPENLCSNLLGWCNGGSTRSLADSLPWTINVEQKDYSKINLNLGPINPERKNFDEQPFTSNIRNLIKQLVLNRNERDAKLPQQAEPSKTYKVLQLSDIHFDLLYKEGSVAECSENICCRSDSPVPKGKSRARVEKAGKWGTIGKCEIPYKTTVELFRKFATVQNEFEYVLWTGDLLPHDNFNKQNNQLLIYQDKLMQLFKIFLASTPVYSAIGNHDTETTNLFPVLNITKEKYSKPTQKLYAKFADDWSDRGIPKMDLTNMTTGGYYSALVQPGFRIISLNNNYCFLMNLWLIVDPTDPAHELQWLANTLQAAESAGEKVHIIAHHPPGGSNCLMPWSWAYNKLIARYWDTVRGQFFGHQHGDAFQIFYDDEVSIPINVGYTGPSLTSYQFLSPAYRVYTVDRQSRNVLDAQVYYLNISKANEKPNEAPIWEVLYSTKEAYDMKSLSPGEWEGLVKRMPGNHNLLRKFQRHRNRLPLAENWRPDVLKEELCGLISSRTMDKRICQKLGLNFHNDLLEKIIPKDICEMVE